MGTRWRRLFSPGEFVHALSAEKCDRRGTS